MTSPHALALLGIVLALFALVLALASIRRARTAERQVRDLERRTGRLEQRSAAAAAASAGDGDAPAKEPMVAVVLNPSKFASPERAQQQIAEAVARDGGGEARFYLTTKDDPGHGQATQAVSDGASLVLAAGGDGTVRMVASALADGEVAMGIVPTGTGNLLARNMSIPLEDIPGAVRIALDRRNQRRIDVGWLRHGRSEADIEVAPKEIFLVMAGFGADAEVIGATDSTLKKRIGWIAYVVAGISKIVGRSHDVRVTLPGDVTYDIKARTVLIGNVGKLPGGIVLMPDATIDNGRLEVLAMGWRNAAGLSQIGARLLAPGLGSSKLLRLSSMERYLLTHVRLEASRDQPVQLDGDMAPSATIVVAEVDPGALIIRAPSAA